MMARLNTIVLPKESLCGDYFSFQSLQQLFEDYSNKYGVPVDACGLVLETWYDNTECYIQATRLETEEEAKERRKKERKANKESKERMKIRQEYHRQLEELKKKYNQK